MAVCGLVRWLDHLGLPELQLVIAILVAAGSSPFTP
jgi:hypothetical protein